MSINPNIVLISGDILTLHPNIGLRNLFLVSRDLHALRYCLCHGHKLKVRSSKPLVIKLKVEVVPNLNRAEHN